MNTDKLFAQSLAKEYAPKSTSKVVALKKLDRKAKMPAMVFTYSFGICMILIFGVGMCLTLGVIGSASMVTMAAGIVIGVIGIAGMAVNYPIYKRILEAGKKKHAFEIMELINEICAEE